MIVIVQNSDGEEVFRFNQDRPDASDSPTMEQIAEALEQARAPLPKVERPRAVSDPSFLSKWEKVIKGDPSTDEKRLVHFREQLKGKCDFARAEWIEAFLLAVRLLDASQARVKALEDLLRQCGLIGDME